mmetsp:Transcript_35456/g.105867  ORF Transcript_35456/g.105867 Transcript_35456/m.105867 type:complete len:125 (-) Transcript_35456:312-686(-)
MTVPVLRGLLGSSFPLRSPFYGLSAIESKRVLSPVAYTRSPLSVRSVENDNSEDDVLAVNLSASGPSSTGTSVDPTREYRRNKGQIGGHRNTFSFVLHTESLDESQDGKTFRRHTGNSDELVDT